MTSCSRPTGDAKPLQKTTTHIPLPPLIPPALSKAPQVVAYHPPSAILHKPFKVTYVLEPPLDWSPAPITLTFQMDAGSENFVSSGPRKVQHTLILHDPHVPQHQLAEFTLIPIANTALVDLPRFRCWHILETPMQHSQRLQALEQEYFDPETGQSEVPVEDSQVRMRELKIVESWQAIADPSAESDDTALSGQIPPRICVLPR